MLTHSQALACPCSQLHASLLQRSLKPARSSQHQASVAAVPVAVREAAFVEAADCFGALLGRAEVRGHACLLASLPPLRLQQA